MSDGMGRELAYLSSHATNRYFIPNWGTSYILCGTEQNDSGIDSIKLEEYTAVLGNRVSLDSIAGTYNGVLPPNVETTLTLNADGTYLLIQSYNEK